MKTNTKKNPLFTCTYCDRVFDRSSIEIHQVDGKEICTFCFAHAKECRDCHTVTMRYVRANYHRNEFLCAKCAENYTTCYGCGSRYRTEELHEYDGDYYCEGCYANCFHDCFGCGERISTNHIYCDSCYNIWCNNVYEYDYKPCKKKFCRINTNKNADAKLYFGLEVELEFTTRKSASIIQELNEQFGDYIYLKKDGSLNNGVEIVTHPCTYRYHMQVFPRERLCKFLNEKALVAQSTCGLHIHFSKKPIMTGKNHNDSNLKKIDYFFEKHREFIIKVSGRSSDSYARFKRERRAETLSRYTGHHSAINFENQATVEVRTFASSIDHLHILSYIDFMNILIQYIKNNNYNTISKIKNFHSYCVQNIEKCPFFIEKFDKILDEAKVSEKRAEEAKIARITQPNYRVIQTGNIIRPEIGIDFGMLCQLDYNMNESEDMEELQWSF
jgi:hypothetical protein